MRKLDFKGLLKELKGLQGSTAISFHSFGDVDAVCSAFALSSAIGGSEVRRVDTVNSQARKVWEKQDLQLQAFGKDELKNFGNLIFVDVSTSSLLGNLRSEVENYRGNLIAIDHHSHNSPLNAKIYCDASKTSCSEVIYEILGGMRGGKEIGHKTALMIALGIIADTANLKSATTSGLAALSECLRISGSELQDVYSMLEVREDASEKIALIEAVKRAEMERVKDVVIASSQVSAFELKCAAALVQLGCDFAVVANQKDGKVSAAKGRGMELQKVNVGELMDEVARDLKGPGGGHEAVGGANFEHSMDALAAMGKLMSRIRDVLL